MPKLLILILTFSGLAWARLVAQSESAPLVVFQESGFPAADSAAPTNQQIAALFPGSRFADANQLAKELAGLSTRGLVLPYGSAFPEEAWPAIEHFLDRGG